MSAVAAIVDPRGRDVASALAAMVGAGGHRGRDGQALWHDGVVGLGTNLHRCLPNDPLRACVHVAGDGRFAAVLDGRIDNAGELAAGGTAVSPGAPDVALVVEHVRRRGWDAFADLIGDFAVIVWDEREQRLLAACDPMAGRALFLAQHEGRVVVASESRQLLAVPWVPDELDLGVIAEVLTGDLRTAGATVHSAIGRIAPGEVVVVDRGDGRVRRRRCWSLEPGYDRRPFATIREDLADRLATAVGCRMRTVGRPAVELSGGLDSSTIAGLAARSAGVAGPLLALTNAYTGGDADERHYARLAADMHGAELHELHDDGTAFDAADDAAFSLEVPGPPDAGDSLRLVRTAAELGATSILTGQGGDQILGGMPAAAIDHMVHGHPVRALSVGWANGRGIAPIRFLRGGYWTFAEPLWAWVRPAGRAAAARRSSFAWLTPAFVASTDLLERLAAAESARRPRRPWDAIRMDAVGGGGVVSQWDVLGRLYGRVPLDSRHPFMDRRLVELAASVPPRYTYVGDDWRSLERAVISGVVPDAIRDRQDKSEFSHLATRTLERLGGRDFFATCEPVRRGWVDRDEIVRRYDAFCTVSSRPPFGASLVATASVHHLAVAS